MQIAFLTLYLHFTMFHLYFTYIFIIPSLRRKMGRVNITSNEILQIYQVDRFEIMTVSCPFLRKGLTAVGILNYSNVIKQLPLGYLF